MSLRLSPWFCLVFAALAAPAVGCEGTAAQQSLIGASEDRACTPGQQTECACAGGAKGFQVCAAAGDRFEACACSGVGTLPNSTDLDAGATSDGASVDPVDPADATTPLPDASRPADASTAVDASRADAAVPADAALPPEGGPGVSCTPTSQVELVVGPKHLVFVIDGSGSMTGVKWTSLVQATRMQITNLHIAASPTVAVGLLAFSDTLDTTDGAGPYPTAADVSLGEVTQAHADRLRARIATAEPSSLTPTKLALEGAYALVNSFVPTSPLLVGGRGAVVIVTDGPPSSGATEENEVIALAATQRRTAGIETFAIAVSDVNDIFSPFLGGLAASGGTSVRATCNPLERTVLTNLCFDYLQAPITASVVNDALTRVVRRVTKCEFPIPGVIPPGLELRLDTPLGVRMLSKNAPDGWRFDDAGDPKSFVVEGAACDALAANAATLHAVTGCSVP